MTSLQTRDAVLILLLGVVMPAIDQFSDVLFALRLMSGPANETLLLSGEARAQCASRGGQAQCASRGGQAQCAS